MDKRDGLTYLTFARRVAAELQHGETHKGAEVNAQPQMVPSFRRVSSKAATIAGATTQQERLRNLHDRAAEELDVARDFGWQPLFCAGLIAYLSVRPLTFSERQWYEAETGDPVWEEHPVLTDRGRILLHRRRKLVSQSCYLSCIKRSLKYA